MLTIKLLYRQSNMMEIMQGEGFRSVRTDYGYRLSWEDIDGQQVIRELDEPGDVAYVMDGPENIHAIRVHDHE